MKIKHLFDDLKIFGKKRYYFKNGEEELDFISSNIIIEIFSVDEKLDIVINKNNDRKNYYCSELLDEQIKKRIFATIHSYNSLTVKCKTISNILIETLCN